ncbi:low molecular weight phosphotyrosine protein phosphatase [Geothrix limicola]|uniref:protein-tyrosine-phosphatase n=1 Tax=Geothrix limicola TaxID=2927978 RepID=A0ABQ5QL65_9BACT|nr:low molecular weight protein-tyrosine-phosphatase [Geothrix limicola]GLH74825.1 low molecular weight phosphotyrosine protein phosphatase [Geothrix limicola]
MKSTPSIHSILVLCVGNHCRAPIAEGLFRAALAPTIQVSSAGLKALVDCPPAPEAARIMKEHGHDISAHRGRQVTAEMALEADLILVMDASQKEWCTQIAPAVRGRIFLLGQWLSTPPRDIEDPFGQGPEAFRRAYEDIRRSVSAWLPHFHSKQRSA